METDRTETQDLAGKQPERVQTMAAQWEAWAGTHDVLPWIWKPAYTNDSPAPARRANPEAGSRAERRPNDLRFTPDPALPNVLLLGDSISIGYHQAVRQALQGKANVFRPINANGAAENCSDTGKGVSELDRWLAAAPKWDVIQFNWGLHDLKHIVPGSAGPKTSPNPADPPLRSVEEYRLNLEKIVARLKQTNARLIFATTTPVPPGCDNPFRSPDDPPRYNAAAQQVMQAAGVRVNDLFGFIQPQLAEAQLPRNVHFTPKGSESLGAQVASVISEELAARTSSRK
jgi:acyl-CoA thioesterase-1